MFNRRQLIRHSALAGSALCSTAGAAPSFLRRLGSDIAPAVDRRVLVVVQLDGGNDALNTVVPYALDGYARHRSALRLGADELVKLDAEVGLHPALEPLVSLLESDRLAVIQNVGYPNPSRSHFRSMATWHTARLEPDLHDEAGWLGRVLDAEQEARPGAGALSIGPGPPPPAVRGTRAPAAALERLEDFAFLPGADPRHAVSGGGSGEDLAEYVRRTTVSAGETADRLALLSRARRDGATYPEGALGRQLGLIASLLEAGHDARVFYTAQTGYDTHTRQLASHQNLLAAFAQGVRAFFDDLDATGLADRVLLLAFSEFGRTLQENASEGTDHGTQGAAFVVAPRVRRSLIGPAPDLEELVDGEPVAGLDFRSIYAALRTQWMGAAPEARPADRFEPLAILDSD